VSDGGDIPIGHSPSLSSDFSPHVRVNVYDLDDFTGRINRMVRVFNTGVFHAGVEVYGVEWSFGQTGDDSTGVTSNDPQGHTGHIYRESIDMGDTRLSPRQVLDLIEQLEIDWPGDSYNILKRNCITFCDQFCELLGVGSLPEWLKSAQTQGTRLGERVDAAVDRIKWIDSSLGISKTVQSMGRAISNKNEEYGVTRKVEEAARKAGSAMSSSLDRLAVAVQDALATASKPSLPSSPRRVYPDQAADGPLEPPHVRAMRDKLTEGTHGVVEWRRSDDREGVVAPAAVSSSYENGTPVQPSAAAGAGAGEQRPQGGLYPPLSDVVVRPAKAKPGDDSEGITTWKYDERT